MKENFDFITDGYYLHFTRGAFKVTVEGLTDALLVSKLQLTLASMPHWTFNAIPKKGRIEGFYLAEDKEALIDIRMYKIDEQYTIEAVLLRGDPDVFYPLKRELMSVFDAHYVQRQPTERTRPPLAPELISTIALDEYVGAWRGVFHMSLAGDKLNCATLIASMSLNPGNPMFDDQQSIAVIIDSLKNLVQDDDLYRPQFRALMACSILYRRPAYQESIRSSRELVTAIYEHAQLESTWKTVQIKQTCTALLEHFVAHNRSRVLRQLKETYPALTDNFFPRTGTSSTLGLFAAAATVAQEDTSVTSHNDISIS